MKKWFKIYINAFSFFIYITSLLFTIGLIDKLDLPKGLFSSLVDYGYSMFHTGSYVALMYYGKETLK